MSNSPFTDLTTQEAKLGQVLYLRVDFLPAEPEKILAGKTLNLAPGGILDIVATPTSKMGTNTVHLSPGLKATYKLENGLLTYRFTVAEDAAPGTRYAISGTGFTFDVEVSK